MGTNESTHTMWVTCLGFLPFLITFLSSFLWSYRFGYTLITKLFGITTSELHKDVELDINLDEDPLSFKSSKSKGSASNIDHVSGIYKIVFSFSMALSLNFIKLILCEIANVNDKKARLMGIKLDLSALTYILTLIQPAFIIILNLNYWITFIKLRIILGLILYVGWLILLNRVGILAAIKQDSFIETKMSEISLIGITAMACLSGVGSISTPFFSFIQKGKLITENHLIKLSDSIKTTENLINLRKTELNKLQSIGVGTIYNNNKSYDDLLSSKQNKFRGFLNRVQSFSNVNGLASKESELTTEINLLNKMHQSLQSDLSDVENQLREQKNSFTLKGRLLLCGRKLFSFYCVYRIIKVFFIRLPGIYFFNDTTNDGLQQDALAVTIAKIIEGVFSLPPHSRDALVNELSFILSGGLFLCSFSSVVTTLSSFSKLSSSASTKSNPSASSLPLKAMVIAELLGTYILSTTLLLRSNLPVSLSKQVSDVLGAPLQVQFIDLWFDKIFALSSVLTVLGLYIKNHINSDFDYEPTEGSKFA